MWSLAISVPAEQTGYWVLAAKFSALSFFPHSIDLIPTHVNVSVHRGGDADCSQAAEALSLFQSGDTTVLEVQEGHRLGSVGLAHIKDQQQT